MSKPRLEEKDFLNPNEAINLFVLSRRKFYKLLQDNKYLDFMAMYGTRRLIVRADFEKYLKAHPELRRRENYGGKTRNET
ncbi:MAG: DNA-binding protein [Bacillota bacterium]|nr:DNA-binding protein [Bacillota bacterium]